MQGLSLPGAMLTILVLIWQSVRLTEDKRESDTVRFPLDAEHGRSEQETKLAPYGSPTETNVHSLLNSPWKWRDYNP